MSVKLSPVFNSQIVDENGNPATGWLINTYIANSSTPATTYTDSTGGTPQSNPIVINTLGFPTVGQIWLTGGVTYKLELTNASGTVKKTEDQISGVNDLTLSQDEWLAGPTPTYISSTQFSLVGDQTSAFHVGRRVKYTVSAGTGYGTITASAFTSLSTITVDSTGSNPLDSGLSAVSYGLLRADNFTQSIGLDHSTRLSAPIVCAATLDLSKAGGDNVHVTGSTGPVTAITLAQGHERTVVWDSTPTLTNGASLILREGASKTVTANSVSCFRGEASGVVREVSYQQSTFLANTVLAGPTSGAAAGPTSRTLVGAESSLVLLGSKTATTTASISFAHLAGTGDVLFDWTAYDEYEFHFVQILPASNANIQSQISEDSGSTYKAGVGAYTILTNFNDAQPTVPTTFTATSSLWVLNYNSGQGTGTYGFNGVLRMYKPSAVSLKIVEGKFSWVSSVPSLSQLTGTFTYTPDTGAWTGIKFFYSGSVNIASGTIYAYGLRKS